MSDNSVIDFAHQQLTREDALSALAREGARRILHAAIEVEISDFLSSLSGERLADGRACVVRNGYQPERSVSTGVGSVSVRMPKTRDRSGQGRLFRSSLIRPYMRKSKKLEELIPVLYLLGVSTNDMSQALESLIGKQATAGVSSSTVSRMKEQWEAEHEAWCMRDLSEKDYLYIWADAIYFPLRIAADARLAVLVMMGVNAHGDKELLAVGTGYAESEQAWAQLMRQVMEQGLPQHPRLLIADGCPGLWKATSQCWPTTKHQRCWVHKMANIVTHLPKSQHSNGTKAIKNIFMAETKEEALKAWSHFEKDYDAAYPKAVANLRKNKQELLTFYDFPKQHWLHIRTSNAIESAFASVRLRTDSMKNCASEKAVTALVFKLLQNAQKRWNRIRHCKELDNVIDGVNFVDGIPQPVVTNTATEKCAIQA